MCTRTRSGSTCSGSSRLSNEEGSAHNGTSHLSDGTYLELLGVVDREKLLKVRPRIVNFLQDHEGAHSVGLLVPSAKEVSDRLESRGIEAAIFNLVRGKPGDKPVLLVTPKTEHLPEGAIFFLEYPPKSVKSPQSQPPVTQPNTAESIVAVWILVMDLSKASEDAEALGFRQARSLESQTLRAQGRQFETGRGRRMQRTDQQSNSRTIAARA